MATADSVLTIYHQQFSGAVNVRWFGAKGDVVEKVGTDDTAAFIAALAAAKLLKCEVYIPAGIYKITGALTVPPNTRVYGDGWDSSIVYYTGITYTGSPGGTMVIHGAYILFNCEPATGFFNDPPKPQNITFENLQITGDNGPSKANTTGVFVQTDGAQQAGHTAIYINELTAPSGDVYVRNCKILNQYSFAFRSDGNGIRKIITDNHFENCAGNCNPNSKEAIFSRNTMVQCWGVEIAGARVDVSNNILRDMTCGGISIAGDGGYAEGEFIDDYDSVTKLGCFSVKCCDNVIDGVGKTPELLGGTALAFTVPLNGAIIARNQISNCAEHGIIQTSAFGAYIPSYCLIIDNIVQSVGNIGIWVGLGGVSNVISRNKVTSNSNTNRGGLTTASGIVLTSGLTDRFVVTDNQSTGWNFGFVLDNCKNLVWRNNRGSVNFQEINGTATFLQDGSTQTISGTGSTNVNKLATTVDVTANGSVTAVLPNPADMGARYRVTINNASTQAGTTTIDSSAGTIDGAATITLVGAYQSVTVESDGTNWRIVARKGADGSSGTDADLGYNSLTISGNTSFGFAGSGADITLTSKFMQIYVASDDTASWNLNMQNTNAPTGARVEFIRTDAADDNLALKNHAGTTLVNIPIAGSLSPGGSVAIFNGSAWRLGPVWLGLS